MNKVLTVILLILSTITFAEGEQLQSSQKQGFLFGVGAGGGILLVKDSGMDSKNYSKMSILNMKFGWMITPETAICLHVPSGGHTQDGKTRAFEAVLVTGQHWLSEKLWGMAGLGLAMDMPPFYDTEEDDPQFYFGSALCAGLGYEIWHRNNFSLDVQGRCLYGNYEVEDVNRASTAFDIMLGFNWY